MPDNRQSEQKHLTPADRQRAVAPRSKLASRGLELALNVRQEKERYARLLRSAEQGHAGAQCRLGLLYFVGRRGVRQDDVEAVRWWREAAEQGHARSQCQLGVMYVKGRGVSKDEVEAVRWWREAAEWGFARAQAKLGFMYLLGEGVPQDYVQAHKWLNLAASQFWSSEQKLREKIVYFREEVASKMTPAQIAEAQRLAREGRAQSDRALAERLGFYEKE